MTTSALATYHSPVISWFLPLAHGDGPGHRSVLLWIRRASSMLGVLVDNDYEGQLGAVALADAGWKTTAVAREIGRSCR